jgi:DNA-binding response OmpR family regulator
MRVLVVEDEVRLALLLKRGLEEEGYAVDTSGDGADALWRATATDYDAVVLDIMLPGMDGLEVTSATFLKGGTRSSVVGGGETVVGDPTPTAARGR